MLLLQSNNFVLDQDSQLTTLGVKGSVTLMNENHVFEHMARKEPHSNEELQKYLPGNFIKRVEKTYLGKRMSANENQSNKR